MAAVEQNEDLELTGSFRLYSFQRRAPVNIDQKQKKRCRCTGHAIQEQ